jgi:hypothetical protein
MGSDGGPDKVDLVGRTGDSSWCVFCCVGTTGVQVVTICEPVHQLTRLDQDYMEIDGVMPAFV